MKLAKYDKFLTYTKTYFNNHTQGERDARTRFTSIYVC